MRILLRNFTHNGRAIIVKERKNLHMAFSG